MSLLLAIANVGGAYNLNAEVGAYTTSGSPVDFGRSYIVNCSNGAYLLSGNSATVARSHDVIGNGGSYAVGGVAATVARSYLINCASGTYSVSGNDASFNFTSAPAQNNEKYYIRRGKKVLLFNTPHEADSYLLAEQEANEAIEKAQKTSRRARKRFKDKIYPSANAIDLIEIEQLSVIFEINYKIPHVFSDYDYNELFRVSELLKQLQEDEDIELLLLM